MHEEIFLVDASVPVQQEEQLALHQVDFWQGEAEAIKTLDGSVSRPVLVLRAGIVQVLGGEDEGSQEDAVDGAAHALGDGRQASAQAAQEHERAHQCGHLDLRPGHQGHDERLDGWQRWHRVERVHGRRGRRRGLAMGADGAGADVGHLSLTSDDLRCLACEMRHHLPRHSLRHKLVQSCSVEGLIVHRAGCVAHIWTQVVWPWWIAEGSRTVK